MEYTIKLCPNCKTPTLKKTHSPFTHTIYECTNSDCDYSGAFYIEIDPDELENWKNSPEIEELDESDESD